MTFSLLQVDGDPVNGPKLTAQQFRQGQAATHGGGSGRRLGVRSGFRVDTPSNVLTATSTTWTLGACAAMIDPGASTHQGGYGWSSDANVTGTVPAADATNPRKDILFIRINDSSAGDGSGSVNSELVYIAGTPAVTPAAPTLPARSFLVGTISVPVAGGGTPTVVLNPARYAAAGAPLPVSSAAERDGLDKYDGLAVLRLDSAGRHTETWNGARWSNGPLGIAYTPIWTGFVDLGTGGSLTGTYWVDGDRVHVRARAKAGTAADLGFGVISCPLPPGFPISGTEAFTLGSGHAVSAGVTRPLTVIAANSTTASVWAPAPPTATSSAIVTPGNASYPFGANDSFEIAFSYQTSAV